MLQTGLPSATAYAGRGSNGCLLGRAIPGMKKLGAPESSVASNISDWDVEPEITVEEPRYDPTSPSILNLYSVDMEQMTITLKVNSTRTISWYVATVDQ